MAIKSFRKETKTLYEAYNWKITGKVGVYEWYIYPDKPDEEVITNINFIRPDGTEFYSEYLGNRCIFMNTFDNNKDEILWWLSHDEKEIDGVTMRKVIQSSLCSNNDLFAHKIRMRKFQEKQSEEARLKKEEMEREHEEKVERIKGYCEKKNYLYHIAHDEVLILEIIDESVRKQILEFLYKGRKENVVNFAVDKRQNQVKLIYNGLIDDFEEM